MSKERSGDNCRLCLHSQAIKTDVIGQWAGICTCNPPVPVAIPVINGGIRGMSVQPMFPPVSAEMVCAQFWDRKNKGGDHAKTNDHYNGE